MITNCKLLGTIYQIRKLTKFKSVIGKVFKLKTLHEYLNLEI